MMKSEVERNGIMKIIAKRELEIEWSKIRVTALSQKWQLALFGLSNILIFALLFNIFALPFNTIYQSPYSGTGLYFDYASNILNGQLPYRDFAIEYPPLSMLFFLLPRLIASNPDSYAIAFGAETLLFSLLSLFLVVLLSRRLGLVPWKSLTIYTLALLAIGPIISRQYDIFPAVTVLLALYAFMSGKHKTSWALLAIATLTKIYPIVFVPILLLHHIRNRQHRHIRLGIITFATTILAIVIPFLIISPGGLLVSFSYHAQRGIQLESIYMSGATTKITAAGNSTAKAPAAFSHSRKCCSAAVLCEMESSHRASARAKAAVMKNRTSTLLSGLSTRTRSR